MKQSHVLFIFALFLNTAHSMSASNIAKPTSGMIPLSNIKLVPIQSPVTMTPLNKFTDEENNAVLQAVIKNDLNFVQNFIKHNRNRINEIKDPVTGNTALMLAADAKHPEMLNMLLHAGAYMNPKNNKGATILEQVVLATNPQSENPKAALEILDLLIRHHINLTGTAGANALILAIAHNNIKVIELLLHDGANMNVHNNMPNQSRRLTNITPLGLALTQPNKKIKQIFLAHDALRIIDVHDFPTTPPQNINAKTQDHYAKYLRRRLQEAFILLKRGEPELLHDIFFDEIFSNPSTFSVVTKFFRMPEDFNTLIDYLAQTDYEKQVAESMHISRR